MFMFEGDPEDLEEKLEPKLVLGVGEVGGTEKDVELAKVVSLGMLRDRSTLNCMTANVMVKVSAQIMRQPRTTTDKRQQYGECCVAESVSCFPAPPAEKVKRVRALYKRSFTASLGICNWSLPLGFSNLLLFVSKAKQWNLPLSANLQTTGRQYSNCNLQAKARQSSKKFSEDCSPQRCRRQFVPDFAPHKKQFSSESSKNKPSNTAAFLYRFLILWQQV
jgi:hypothetical protein